jgi:hypothetical protein
MTKGNTRFVGCLEGSMWENNKSGAPNHLYYCETFISCTKFINLVTDPKIPPGGPRIGDR